MPCAATLLVVALVAATGAASALFGRGDIGDAVVLGCASYVFFVAAVVRAISQSSK